MSWLLLLLLQVTTTAAAREQTGSCRRTCGDFFLFSHVRTTVILQQPRHKRLKQHKRRLKYSWTGRRRAQTEHRQSGIVQIRVDKSRFSIEDHNQRPYLSTSTIVRHSLKLQHTSQPSRVMSEPRTTSTAPKRGAKAW